MKSDVPKEPKVEIILELLSAALPSRFEHFPEVKAAR